MDVRISFEDFQSICRICADSKNLQPLEDNSFIELLEKITNIEFKVGEDLPNNICKLCVSHLESINIFIDKCKTTNDAFQRILQQIKIKKEDSVDDICEDVDHGALSDGSFSDSVPVKVDSQPPVINISEILSQVSKWEQESLNENSKCEGCDKKLSSEELKVHYQENPDCLPSYCKCPICDKSFYPRTKRKLKIHLLSHEKKGYKCPECNSTYPNTKTLRQHVQKMHQDIKPFLCEICKKGFWQKRSLDEHMNFHDGSTPYVCSFCGKGFKRHSLHAKHVYHSHNSESKELPKLSRKYTEKRVHLSLECKECGKVLASRSGFAAHQLIHKGVLNFLCNVCGKKFVTKAALEIHIFTHTGETPHRCKECGKGFRTKFILVKHELEQHTLKSYNCLDCNEQYNSQADFDNHMVIHDGPDPIDCPHCNLKFYNQRLFQNHLLVHKNRPRKTCDICNKSFAFSHIKAHIRSHTGEKAYKCNICGKELAQSQSLKVHMRRHTGEAPYSCAGCDKRFSDSSNMRNHFRRVHGKNSNKNKDMKTEVMEGKP